MKNNLEVNFESALRILVDILPITKKSDRKSILLHSVRVGMYLYEKEYAPEIVLAGLLHDSIEWGDSISDIIMENFGKSVMELILANTKNKSIKDSIERNEDLIDRCIGSGENALIIKAVDIIDSFEFYAKESNQVQINSHCRETARIILDKKPVEFEDEIFEKLKQYYKNIQP